MKLLPTILVFVLALTSFACSDGGQQAAWDQVMVVHDEIMPKMGEMRSLSKRLDQYAGQDSLLDLQIINLQQQLEIADDAMMDWMHELQPLENLKATQGSEEVVEYLGEQETSMRTIGEQTNVAIEQAVSFIKKQKGNE